jgi:hypothetical protein
MSLEQSLDNHAAAIRELIAAFGGKAGNIPLGPLVAVREGSGTETKAETKKSVPNAKAGGSTNTPKPDKSSVDADVVQSVTEHQSAAVVESSPEANTRPADGVDPISFSTARDLVLKLASANKRDEVKAVNAKHGIAKLGSLLKDENDYDSVVDMAKLRAVYDDLLAIEV